MSKIYYVLLALDGEYFDRVIWVGEDKDEGNMLKLAHSRKDTYFNYSLEEVEVLL